MSGTIRILSIDGGGIRGIIPALVLASLEGRLGGPVGKRFHLISGSSTGGILAAGLAHPTAPIEAKELVSFYKEEGPRVFKRSLWKGFTSLGGATDERYDADALENALQGALGDARLSQVSDPELLVTAYEIETRQPFFFKSWRARGVAPDADVAGEDPRDRDFALWRVCRATSAAPTYFEPARTVAVSEKESFLVDGGLVANNPSMCALASARRIYPGATQYMMVSLGTGVLERTIPYEEAIDWGLIGWARPLLSIFMSGTAEVVDYQCRLELPNSYWRLQTSLAEDVDGLGAPNDDLDDASRTNIRRLEIVADRMLESEAGTVNEIVEALGAPRDELTVASA